MRHYLLFALLLLGSATSTATTLVAGCGGSIPPYVIPQNDRGMALDILRQALATQGYQLNFRYASNEQLTTSFNAGELDIACISNATVSPSAYFSSQPLMVLHNIAISLNDDNLTLDNMAQLSKYRINAFNYATRFLPAEYAAAVASSPEYKESSEQIQQIYALFHRQTQVIVLDQTIFRYFLSQVRRKNPNDQALQLSYRYHNLFAPNYYYAAFHSAAIRDAFDEGLRILKDSGDYEKLMAGYERMLAGYLFR